jgi:hypothetical protein
VACRKKNMTKKNLSKESRVRSLEEHYNLKPLKDILILPTKRLLTYYKSERLKFFSGGFICSCCQEFQWNIHSGYEGMKKDYHDWEARLESIKAELNTREHIPVKPRKSIKALSGGRTTKLRRCTAVNKRKMENERRYDVTRGEIEEILKDYLSRRSTHA